VLQNRFKYNSITYDTILKEIDAFIESDTKFGKFRGSAIAQTLNEIFAGTTDILTYYLGRRAEECYFDTAQLKSSVISLSRMFGYVMSRREPARAKLKIIVKGNIQDNQIQIPAYSKFSYGGNNYVLLKTMTYRLTANDLSIMNTNGEFSIVMDSFGSEKNIDIIQGDIREKVFVGANNPQVGAPFQMYKIEDASFSNQYGDKDIFYDKVTQVYVGQNKSKENRFDIDRRSLLNWDYINSSDLSVAKNVCMIRTSPDGYVELLFGDADPYATNTPDNPSATGGFARKGATSRQDNIYVQYLSTVGSSANAVGVIGDKVNFSGQIYNSKGDPITNMITFQLESNIYGGSDDESMDSIKYSAPKIYNSLDRLVSKSDYIAFLKTLQSPIQVKNAVVWSEQEERDRAGAYALFKMFNVVLFTLAGSLYNTKINPHIAITGEDYDSAVLDMHYDPYKLQTQGYMNVYTMQDMVNQIKQYTISTQYYAIIGDNFNLSGDGSPIVQSITNTGYCGTQAIAISNQMTTIASNIKSLLNTHYRNGGATFSFTYKSNYHECSANIVTTATATIPDGSFDSINSDGEEYLKSLATLINTALYEVKDYRGNRIENANFGKTAFYGRCGIEDATLNPAPIVEWFAFNNNDTDINSNPYSNDNDNNGDNVMYYGFRLKFNELKSIETPQSPCYIESFETVNVNSFLSIIGLSGEKSDTIVETKFQTDNNGKITQVVDELQKRSQVNVKNIYVSPIIHRFNLVGDIYIKPLYDTQSVRDTIANNIYSWLDINADFNKPLYLSNIVEIIESNDAVINANVKLIPEDRTAGVNNTCNLAYDPNFNTNWIYQKYGGVCGKILADAINGELKNYLGSGATKIGYNLDRSIYIPANNKVESSSYTLINSVTERSFYDTFAGKLYKTFKTNAEGQSCGTSYICNGKPNYATFIGYNYNNVRPTYGSDIIHSSAVSSDFAVIMEQIHKDLSYLIMTNLLDSNGNIDKEYDPKTGKYLRGGYSLGSEIVQVLLNSWANNKPLLNIRYK